MCPIDRWRAEARRGRQDRAQQAESEAWNVEGSAWAEAQQRAAQAGAWQHTMQVWEGRGG
jgi:hypothetical protein